MVWAKNVTETLTSSSLFISPASFTSKTFNQIISHMINIGGTFANDLYHVGNGTVDTANNYSYRREDDGVTNTNANEPGLRFVGGTDRSEDYFLISNMVNITVESKLHMGHLVTAGAAGAGNAPHRNEFYHQWANTVDQFDIYDLEARGTGSMDTDSNTTMLGTD